MSEISPQVLELLACPEPTCHGKLTLESSTLACAGCRRRYRIEHGFPVLIPEEAQSPTDTIGD